MVQGTASNRGHLGEEQPFQPSLALTPVNTSCASTKLALEIAQQNGSHPHYLQKEKKWPHPGEKLTYWGETRPVAGKLPNELLVEQHCAMTQQGRGSPTNYKVQFGKDCQKKTVLAWVLSR